MLMSCGYIAHSAWIFQDFWKSIISNQKVQIRDLGYHASCSSMTYMVTVAGPTFVHYTLRLFLLPWVGNYETIWSLICPNPHRPIVRRNNRSP